MVYDYDSSKKNKRVTDGAPPKINVTPIQVSPKFIVEIFKSELKFNGKTFNQDAANAAWKQVFEKENANLNYDEIVIKSKQYENTYNSEVEKRTGVAYKDFIKKLLKQEEGFFSLAHEFVANKSCKEADNEVKDNILNSREYEQAQKLYNEKLKEVKTDLKAFTDLFLEMNPKFDQNIAKNAAKNAFESMLESEDISLGDAFKQADSFYFIEQMWAQEMLEEKIKEHTPNGKFDKAAIQTTGSCDVHGHVVATIQHEKGRKYMESLVKVQEDGSEYVFLPGVNKQYHYSKEELAKRSDNTSSGDGDMTAIVCAIEDYRRSIGCDPWYEADIFKEPVSKLLFNDNSALNLNIVVEEIPEEPIIYRDFDFEYKQFQNIKNTQNIENKETIFKNNSYTVLNMDKNNKKVQIKTSDNKTSIITYDDFVKKSNFWQENKKFIDSFTESQKNNNTLFKNDFYTVIDVQDQNNIIVKEANNDKTITITREKLESMHIKWKEADKIKKDFKELKTKFNSGNYCITPAIPSGIEVRGKYGILEESPLLKRHAYSLVDIIDENNIILVESNCPDLPITVTYEEFRKMAYREFKIPEPIKWEIKK